MIRPFSEPIYVTRPLLPALDELQARLGDVWKTQWLTNGGEQHEQLERAIAARLGVEQLSLFNNGTIALLIAIRALNLRGEVITTPFTFPATPHVLAWAGITPVFADIDPVRLTIDPAHVEALVTPKTTAILGVHVYGTPCDVDALSGIAARRGLRVVYDGAHAFGVRIDGRGVGTFGDATMFSFHATKLFHTAEGGAIACADAGLRHRIERLKNFGIAGQEEVEGIGLNGKMNELQAALGMTVLAHVDEEVARRRELLAIYQQRLGRIEGLTLMPQLPGVESSCQYCAVLVDHARFGRTRDEVHETMKTYNVFTRKYFYPLCSDYESYRDLPSARPSCLPVARRAASQVLCLPLYGTLGADTVQAICDLLLSTRRAS
ncbi:MAG TPA: DegT/DnrJ/EryC1/StrS family aminotransferase [Vicinamibacterales bacterium]|nr:DegT/DnrJ/EryC1/StrS family aminotransferase [Vicinamibacterales bacterium]